MAAQKGFVPVLLVILVAIFAIGGYFAYQQVNKSSSTPPPNEVACTQDAKLCPDGTSVGRVGPKCDFSPCPSPKESSNSADITNWKTYNNTKYEFSFSYPPDWKLSTQNGTDNSSFFITLTPPVQRSQLGDNINIDVHDDKANLSIEQYISKIAGSDPYQYKLIEVGRMQAREYLNLPEASAVRRIYLKRASHIYEFAIQSDFDDYTALFDQILSTFKFLP